MKRQTRFILLGCTVGIMALVFLFFTVYMNIVKQPDFDIDSSSYILNIDTDDSSTIKIFQSKKLEFSYTIRTESKQKKHEIYLKDILNDTNKSISYDFSYIAGNNKENIIFFFINDNDITNLEYTDNTGAGSTILQPDVNHTIDDFTQTASLPQYRYILNGSMQGTLVGKNQQGQILYKEDIKID